MNSICVVKVVKNRETISLSAAWEVKLSSDKYPGHQYFRQPGPEHRTGPNCRRVGLIPALDVLGSSDRWNKVNLGRQPKYFGSLVPTEGTSLARTK